MPRNDAQPIQPPPRAGRSAPGDPRIADIPWVRLTQREQPRPNRRRVIGLVAAVLAGHAVLVAWLWWNPPRPHAAPGEAIEVTLSRPEATPPAPPPLPPPPPILKRAPPSPPPAPTHRPVPRAPGSITATMEESPRSQLDLYDRQGQVELPQGGSPTQTPAYRTPEPKGSSALTIKTPLDYKPTRFEKDWADANRSEGGKLFDRMVDKTTVSKTMHTPTGDRITCSVSPLLILVGGLGCHGHIPPPPENDDDIRLSMPPPETLTGKKVKLPASATSSPPPASGTGG